jgi:hypothetical protein
VKWALCLFLLLAACSDEPSSVTDAEAAVQGNSDDSVGRALDKAAVETGIIPGESNIAFEGSFERRSDLGTDRFCAVADGDDYRVGLLTVYGADSQCEARGSASREGENVTIVLDGTEQCRFIAHFDGIELALPGALPDGCAHYCSDRASLSGTSFYFVEQGKTAAAAQRGRKLERLCP